MARMSSFVLVLLMCTVCGALRFRSSNRRCEDLQESMCSGLPYSKTIFPNTLGLADQEKAKRVFKHFHPLISVKCFRDMKLFLCSIFFPICTKYDQPLMPCRSLCRKAKRGCLPIMKRNGFGWPLMLQCKKFPRSKDQFCIERPDGKKKKEKKKRGESKH